jgi:8-oxo-dGTP diphosphatase
MISMNVALYDLHSIDDSKLSIATVMARYQDKWIFVRCREETTWQIPGGHREENENIRQAASRELIEETGAEQFSLIPICISFVLDGEKESFGVLFYSKIERLGELPDSEIEEVALFETLPKEQTFPDVHSILFEKAEEFERSLMLL